MLGRERGEARRVKQVAAQLVVEAGVPAGTVVVVRIVLVVVEREDGPGSVEVGGAWVVMGCDSGDGDCGIETRLVETVVLSTGLDGRLELTMLDTVAVVVKVELDSTLEAESEGVSFVTMEDEVGSVKDVPRL